MLSWAAPFSLILFDFDGLLVNTEKIHYMAYQETLKKLGFTLTWDFAKYVSIAHFKAEGLEEEIYKDFPELKKREPEWKSIYRVKRETYLKLLEEREVEWMPGAEELLIRLHDSGQNLVVATHSDSGQIALIKAKLEKLSLIPHWITREDYVHPKPSSDCYKLAISKYAPEGGKVIGFEDSPRGLSALMGTEAMPVLVTDIPYPEIDFYRKQGVVRLRSLSETLREGFRL
jgi:beta-phosphoglucomutase